MGDPGRQLDFLAGSASIPSTGPADSGDGDARHVVLAALGAHRIFFGAFRFEPSASLACQQILSVHGRFGIILGGRKDVFIFIIITPAHLVGFGESGRAVGRVMASWLPELSPAAASSSSTALDSSFDPFLRGRRLWQETSMVDCPCKGSWQGAGYCMYAEFGDLHGVQRANTKNGDHGGLNAKRYQNYDLRLLSHIVHALSSIRVMFPTPSSSRSGS